MSNQKKEDLLGEYIDTVGKIDKMLKRLQKAAENHFDVNPDEAEWGDVSTLKHVEMHIGRAVDFLFIETNYDY